MGKSESELAIVAVWQNGWKRRRDGELLESELNLTRLDYTVNLKANLKSKCSKFVRWNKFAKIFLFAFKASNKCA